MNAASLQVRYRLVRLARNAEVMPTRRPLRRMTLGDLSDIDFLMTIPRVQIDRQQRWRNAIGSGATYPLA